MHAFLASKTPRLRIAPTTLAVLALTGGTLAMAPAASLAQSALDSKPPAAVRTADAGLQEFSIPASELGQALAAFAQQTGINLSVNEVSIDGRSTRGVKGRLTAENALRALLVNTGLRAEATGERGFSLRVGTERGHTSVNSPNPLEPAIEMDTVVVRGSADRESFKADVVQVGTFRNQSILDVPLTISVATRALMDAQAVQDLGDVLRNTPNVTQQNNNPLAVGAFVFRGIHANARTNYRLNGSLPAINLVTLPLENKQRVETLKGTSALYYGFTSPSAIVNMVTKRAGPEPYNSISVQADSDGTAVPHLDVGRTFGENRQFGARINAAGGHLGSPVDGADGRRSFLSGAFDWRVNSDLTFRLDVESYKRVMDERGVITLPNAVNGKITLPQLPSPSNRYAAKGMTYEGEADNVLLRSDYLINDDWTVLTELGQSRASRTRTTAQLSNYDVRTGLGSISGNYQNGQDHRNRIARVELGGRHRTGPLDHTLTFGVNWHQQYQAGVATYAYTRTAQNIYNPIALDNNDLVYRAPTYSTPSTITDTGAYVLDRINIGERWMAMGGLRALGYKQRGSDGNYDQDKVTPSLGLIFSPTPRSSLYATYIEGLESSGTAPDTAANANELMRPAISKQYELGYRTEVAGGLMASIAAFRIDRPLAYTNERNVYVLDGKANYQGIEGSVQGELTRRLSVVASAGWLRARQRDTGVAAQNGLDIENTPHWTASLFGQYRVPAVEGLSLNAGAYYMGGRFAESLNQARLPGYTLLGVGASYRTKLASSHTLTLRLNVDNLTDKLYWATGGRQLNVGLGRSARVSATYEF